MPSAQEREQHREMEQHKRGTLDAVIGEQVINILGEPGNLLQTQVRLLWNNSYRVNLLVGADVTCAKVANSYFIKTDSDGNILESTPKITKQY
jgi:hypothetical protein